MSGRSTVITSGSRTNRADNLRGSHPGRIRQGRDSLESRHLVESLRSRVLTRTLRRSSGHRTSTERGCSRTGNQCCWAIHRSAGQTKAARRLRQVPCKQMARSSPLLRVARREGAVRQMSTWSTPGSDRSGLLPEDAEGDLVLSVPLPRRRSVSDGNECVRSARRRGGASSPAPPRRWFPDRFGPPR